ncbi:MAG: DUF493 domain-containing protein [Desulfuromonadales bacterium]|nr:DUF493 domain-containing protein [Desulfuromonadales bacterium]
MSDVKKPEDLFEFPCHYQFKAVGVAGEGFRAAVIEAIGKLAAVSDDAVKSRPSGKGNFQSVSVMVTLHNFAQLKGIYSELRQIPGMKMLL